MFLGWSDRRNLETSRLILEPLREQHGNALYAGFSDKRIYDYIPGQPPSSAEQLMERYARVSTGLSPDQAEEWLNWAIKRKGTNYYVGRLEATVPIGSSTATVAFIVVPDEWRKGYAREGMVAVMEYLARERRIQSFRAIVDRRNIASIGLLRSLGFHRTAAMAEDAETIAAGDDLYERES